ncbi:4-hydroxythreonine-4-phosphate dehydrogenase PdxA [Burkholderia multivorans]|uniref:PdxA family dehydrogenase n=1 Tax=Burkholderia multivorans TaxID=87883 RepID=UPI00201944DF|nr:4-hydroxythreonine-4-phosphate dehydrogenase PdxA [Burkholderia multivorans]MCL4661353.1 4-hydroxythreonine-4-phosphate dehydrogenase PdxA [Burkholderia multivorans]MCO1352783.1 4-hydroxythreonine-4-phosphate dehydrogenase PdxA [Burkholderia multivorans]MCO1413370.1 4-hydroxythreonine-4-phosphate dehydrogenase PdxA [Burkholderia multivorans]MCO1446439.1 4-hydroxythreonine-4-phosphate dehydrogenase PdxA [Burkholderia multivorans]UQP46852.1 4-hydroxythreonine-4-phosphate dehydrogenase PdxA [B
MTNNRNTQPAVGIMIGDPCGIGPEVVAKAWHTGKLHECSMPVLIGSCAVMREAARITGLPLEVRRVDGPDECDARSDTLDVIEPVAFDAGWVQYGKDVERAGWASGMWLEHADRLARQGILDATVMGPISSASLEMAGTLNRIATHGPEGAYLLLRSSPLMIAHLTDHIPLREVPGHVQSEPVGKLIRFLDASMKKWGIEKRRIAVAGLNPHADGQEERGAIIPAIEAARNDGIDVHGPVSPDSVFRHCIEGRYDVVIALYHDQGHIAMKTWGFSGNSVVMLGPPYVHTTVAHGVAYELAGSGRADHTMILSAILNAAYLAAGRGFHE